MNIGLPDRFPKLCQHGTLLSTGVDPSHLMDRLLGLHMQIPLHPAILDECGNPVHGTPGMVNWASTVTETPTPFPTATLKPTPTFAPTPVPAVDLNEILPRPGSDWNGDGAVNNGDEFIEVENLGPGIADSDQAGD